MDCGVLRLAVAADRSGGRDAIADASDERERKRKEGALRLFGLPEAGPDVSDQAICQALTAQPPRCW